MNQPLQTDPDLRKLFTLFPSPVASDESGYQEVPGDQVPPPYHGLLVHEHHMTVTVEAYHGDLVDVRILAQRQDDDAYARQILLTLQQSGRVVQYGVMRIHFRYCTDAVKEAIVAGRTPLGRILIEHNVLRRIEPKAFLRVMPGKMLTQWFGLKTPKPTYGRLAIIHCDHQPAVELLEVVVPE
jgi:hypothetical protein